MGDVGLVAKMAEDKVDMVIVAALLNAMRK